MQPVGPNGIELKGGALTESSLESRNEVEANPALVFTAYIQEGNTVIDVPKDIFERILVVVTNPKTMGALRLTCKMFHQMSEKICPSKGLPIIGRLFLGKDLREKVDQLASAINKEEIKNSEHLFVPRRVFLDSFRNRCQSININALSPDNEYASYACHAFGKVEKKLPADNPIILRTTNSFFFMHVFEDMFQVYTAQPAANMTPHSFRRIVESHRMVLPDEKEEYVKTRIRVALHQKVGFIEELQPLIKFYRSDQGIADVRSALEIEFKAKIKSLEEEMRELRGPNGFDGTIDAAWRCYQSAAKELEFANTEYEAAGSLYSNSDSEIKWKDAAEVLIKKFQVRDPAFCKYKDLNDRLNQIAEFDGLGNIISGELCSALRELDGVDWRAKSGAIKLSMFYNELSIPLNRDNINARFAALDRIIG